MPLQRRYSVTGQTPPDDLGIKEPNKPQALDTNVQQTDCRLCEGGAGTGSGGGGGEVELRSSKRSATQLPSPNTPTAVELPTKIARLGLETGDMDMDMEIDSEGALTEGRPFSLNHKHSDRSDFYHRCSDSDPLFRSRRLFFNADGTPMTYSGGVPPQISGEYPPFRGGPSSYSSSDPFVEYPNPPSLLFKDQPVYEPPTPTKPAVTLLTLPPEIRHQIYLHVPHIIQPHPLVYSLSTFRNLKQHPLASVSRLIRRETLAILYSYNTWVIKLEFRMMYDAFLNWIQMLGPEGASSLRVVVIGIRGRLFRSPKTNTSRDWLPAQLQSAALMGIVHPRPRRDILLYNPPDGDASFRIDLSQKFEGGKVEVVRCDGGSDAAEFSRRKLQELVGVVWEKRCRGCLRGEDWVGLVERFLEFCGSEF